MFWTTFQIWLAVFTFHILLFVLFSETSLKSFFSRYEGSEYLFFIIIIIIIIIIINFFFFWEGGGGGGGFLYHDQGRNLHDSFEEIYRMTRIHSFIAFKERSSSIIIYWIFPRIVVVVHVKSVILATHVGKSWPWFTQWLTISEL